MTRDNHTRAYTVTMTVHLVPWASIPDVHSLVHDLEWVGRCRDPEDAAFFCLTPSEVKVSRQRLKDKAP